MSDLISIAPVADFVADYGLPVMQTEHRAGNSPWVPEFDPNLAPNDHDYAEESWGLITEWVRAGVSSYLAWNMVLDTVGLNLDAERPWPQNALLVVDRAAGPLSATPTYYLFRHLSHFVAPGAQRMTTVGDVDALAFRNPDGGFVTVVYNPGSEPRALTLAMPTTQVRFTVPARGWATANWPQPGL